MEVTDVTSVLVGASVGRNRCYVRVDTDEGVHGWGQCYTRPDREEQIATYVDELGRYLVGRDPGHVKHFCQMAYSDFASRRGSMDLYSATSGVEQALWDIKGKHLGVPVHRLLGGACRDEVRVYANGWAGDASTPAELADRAEAVVADGFDALKVYPKPGPWRTHVTGDVVERAVENVRAVREAVGPDVDLLVDMHRSLAPMHVTRIARETEQFDPFWFEEPVLAENLDALAAVRRDVDLPVVTGEELYTKYEFREVFEKAAADVVNPDVGVVGGILELKEIAAMAEPYYVAVAPHNYSTTVGLAATLHTAAAMPNFLVTEYFVNLEPVGHEVARDPFEVTDGTIQVPEEPGLGVELDEDAVADNPPRSTGPRSFRTYDEERP